MTRPHFPALIDNTQRSDFRKCHQSWKRGFIDCITGSTPNIHLHAGGAFAHSLETARRAFYEHGSSEAEALRAGLEALIKFYGPIELPQGKTGDKSCENVVRAYDSYMRLYPLGKDIISPLIAANGRAMVEFAFALPTEIKHPETGDPILFGGRADMIGVMDGALYVTDEKTASSLGEQWARNWKLDSQFTGYIAAAKSYGFPVVGALVRGVGLLKTKITHAQEVIIRSQWEVDRWWEQLHRDIKAMIRCWEEGYYDFALDKSACNAYGGCSYEMLCASPEPEQWIPLHYRRRVWNPLEKDSGEKLLENPELRKALETPELFVPEIDEVLRARTDQ